MTRILADLLQAEEPHFRLNLRQLEKSSGHPNTDITLTVQVIQAAKQKVRQLGLDPEDTTGEELYHTLLERVSADDRRLERALRTQAATYISAEADLMAGLVHALAQESKGHNSFALKPAVSKRLLKKNAPKRVIKHLGYRSFDSMLRHEQPAAIIAAALSLESTAWRRTWIDGYKTVKPSDFESRKVKILCPTGERWSALTQKILEQHRYTVVGLRELGTVIVLPLPTEKPAGAVVASLVLALQQLNQLQADSNYLQTSQVRSDFGQRVQAVTNGTATLSSKLQNQLLPWHLVQQYFARTKAVLQEDVLGPYAEATKFYWHDIEATLSRIAPALEFWHGSAFLAVLHDGKPVSCNVLDAAINCCNQVGYELRSAYHGQQALWSELTLRYLNRDNVEAAIAAEVQPQLAEELAVS